MTNKKQDFKTIISCSRRTDVISCYYKWLQKVLKDEYVIWQNLYNNKDYTIDLKPENIHSIVLWSKNYANLIKTPGLLSNYNLYFQFTINGYGSPLEPNILSLEKTLAQIYTLADKYSPEQISWRYDPLLFIKKGDPVSERLETFDKISTFVSECGIDNCVISFTSFYQQAEKRLKDKNIEYFDFDDDFKIMFSRQLTDIAEKKQIQIYSCNNPILEKNEKIIKSKCIDAEKLKKLIGGVLSHAKDSSQRSDCGCNKSKDIGSYSQICGNACLYCYANPFQI